MKKVCFILLLISLLFFKVNFVSAAQRCTDYSEDVCSVKGCSWNDEHNFCSPDGLTYLACGDTKDIPEMVPVITSFVVTLLKTATPIILIVMSVISMIKAITAGKEDEIKKAKSSFIKRLIYGALVFFVVTIVQFVMLKVASDKTEHDSLSNCLSCFLNGSSDCGGLYYKDGYGYCYWASDTPGTKMFKCSDLGK